MAVITAISLVGNAIMRRSSATRGCRPSVWLAPALWLLVPATVTAQQWEIEPSLEVIATYTDNVFLALDGLEEDDFVGQLNPGITIERDQGALTTNIRYRLQSVFFESDSDLDAVYHQLDAVALLEVAPERFFIDFDAQIDQTVADPTISIPSSNVVATENLGDVYVGEVNPYFIQRLGGADAYLRLDYVYGIGRYDGFGLETFSNVDDFTQNRAAFFLGSDARETGFEWSLTYDYQFVDYEIARDYKFERASMGLTIPVGRGLRLVALGGLESDLIASAEIGGLDSDFWEVGFRLNAGQRNVLEFRTGERFFGTSYFGNIQFSGRRMLLSVLYRENPTTSALDGLGSPVAPFDVTEGDPLFEDPPKTDDIVIQPVRAEVYVARTLTARFEYVTGKTTLYATYSDEERDFDETDGTLDVQEDDQQLATFGFEYELGARTDIGLAASWSRYGFTGTDAETEVAFVTLGVIRSLGQRTDLRLSYRHAVQETTAVSGFGEYTENAVDLGAIFRF